MSEYRVTELIQVKMRLEQRVKELKMEIRLAEAEIKFLKEKIELLSINQLEIDFDGKTDTTQC
jgi:hypothetical protein